MSRKLVPSAQRRFVKPAQRQFSKPAHREEFKGGAQLIKWQWQDGSYILWEDGDRVKGG